MSYGLLIDTTRCIGCRGCQVACKQSNALPGENTMFRPIPTNPPDLTSKTWSLVEFHEVISSQGNLSWHFVKRQCMHCLEPACVSVCPVGALQKTREGAVVYLPIDVSAVAIAWWLVPSTSPSTTGTALRR